MVKFSYNELTQQFRSNKRQNWYTICFVSKTILYIISLSLLLSGCASQSGGSSATMEESSATNKTVIAAGAGTTDGYPDRMVCRTMRKPNSRMTEKICKTAAEWERAAEADRRAVDKVQRDANIGVSTE